MKILVTGCRKYQNFSLMRQVLSTIHRNMPITCIVEGGAKGADRYAKRWAENHGIEVRTVHAEWKRYGNGAGPIRNRRMLRENPDIVAVLAFGKGQGGTDNMVKIARKAGLWVEEYDRATTVPD